MSEVFVYCLVTLVAFLTGILVRDFWIAVNPGKVIRGLFGDFVGVPAVSFVSLEEHTKEMAEKDERLNEALLELTNLQTPAIVEMPSTDHITHLEAALEAPVAVKQKAPRKSRAKTKKVDAVIEPVLPQEDETNQ